MGVLGAWKPLYTGKAFPYPIDGSEKTYRLAAELFEGMSLSDRGCGTGWMRRYHDGPYIGVDGTDNAGCDVVADLASYRTKSEGILLRHVLEHDERWADILDSAVASATRRLVVILYTPLQAKTGLLQMTGLGDVVELGFCLSDLTDRMGAVQLISVGSETVLIRDVRQGLAEWINDVDGIEGKRYLELGVYDGATFHGVRAHTKVGVDCDPLTEATHVMTTDSFFAQNTETFDVVLVDADHHFEQVLVDFDNACSVLAPGGVIFVHDLVPPDHTFATPEPSREDGGWCGDGYKLLYLARKKKVKFTTLDEPFGLTRFDNPKPLG